MGSKNAISQIFCKYLVIVLNMLPIIMCMAFDLSELRIVRLRCEYKANPVGIDIKQPRLSWEIESNLRETIQTAYQKRNRYSN